MTNPANIKWIMIQDNKNNSNCTIKASKNPYLPNKLDTIISQIQNPLKSSSNDNNKAIIFNKYIKLNNR